MDISPEQLEDQLHDDFESAEGFLVPRADGHLAWASERRHDPDEDEDRGIDVWAGDGQPIYRSGASAALPPVALTAATAAARYESLTANGRQWRTLTGTTLVGGRSVVMRASRSEDRLRAQVGEMLVVLEMGGRSERPSNLSRVGCVGWVNVPDQPAAQSAEGGTRMKRVGRTT